MKTFQDQIRQRGWSFAPELLPVSLVNRINAELAKAISACGALRAKVDVEQGNEGIAHHVLGMGGVFLEFVNMLPLQEELQATLGGKIILNSFGGFTHKPQGSTYA